MPKRLNERRVTFAGDELLRAGRPSTKPSRLHTKLSKRLALLIPRDLVVTWRSVSSNLASSLSLSTDAGINMELPQGRFVKVN